MDETERIKESWRSRVYRGAEAEARLVQMRLSSRRLLAAVARGDEKRKECGPLHPKTFPGQVMWAETTEALRRQLIPTPGGWAAGHLNNFESVYSTEVGVGIVVAGGDAFTGIDGARNPSFTRTKGPKTQLRLTRNRSLAQQPTFDGMEDEADEEAVQTWFLLCNAREGHLFVEFSFLTVEGTPGSGSVWPERILLDPFESSNAVTPVTGTDYSNGDDPPPRILVERRQ